MAYRLSKTQTLSFNIPYVTQGTDHISIVPNYPEFLIKTRGLGDIGVSLQHKLFEQESRLAALNVGLSLPTGSIDEQGDTPRAPGNQQLPYTMQLGSGTYDLKIGASFTQSLSRGNWMLDASYLHRLEDNDRNYRLGNRFSLRASADVPFYTAFAAGFGVSYQHSGDISGRDKEITVPGPFPFPAGITNPENFGGQFIRAEANVRYRMSDRLRLKFSYVEPLWQDLNGIQPEAKGRWNISWSMDIKRSSTAR